MVDRAAHRFSYVEYWPPPRCFRRKKSSGFANAGRICEIYILRCRGRCPHRPAGNDRFMAAFRRNRVHFLFYAVGVDDPVRPPENALFHGKPMRNRNILMGGQSRPPLQTGYDRPVVSSNSVHQISAVPRYFGRKKSSDFANVGRIREIYIPRRRGRCPHRPARNGRFMAVFRRTRADFPFCTVGADDPVRPRNCPFLRKTDAKSKHFRGPMWASAPTKDLTKRNIFPFRAVGVDAARLYRQSPYKIHRKEPIPWKKSDRTRYPASWSCCLRRRRRWRP